MSDPGPAPPESSADRSTSVWSALRSRPYRRIWIGGLVAQLGQWLMIFARSVYAYRLADGDASLGARNVGLVYLFSYGPQIVMSLAGGVIADRFDRRLLLIWSQVMQAIGALAIAIMLVTGTDSLAMLLGVSFFVGVFFALSIPAQQALLPSLVETRDLDSAISLGTAANSICRVFGPLLGALMLSLWDLDVLFFANAASFVVIIGAWVLTPIERVPRAETSGMRALMEGVRYVQSTPSVAVPIVVTTVLASVTIVYQPLALVYATEVLAAGEESLGETYNGVIQAVIGTGALVGILGTARFAQLRPALTLLGSAIVVSALLVVLGFVSVVVVAMAVLFVLGAFHFANLTVSLNLVQHEAPEQMRGRVMSIQMLGMIGLIPITSAIAGGIAAAVGVGPTFVGAGLISLGFSVYALRWWGLIRRVEAPTSRSAVAALGTVEEEG